VSPILLRTNGREEAFLDVDLVFSLRSEI
jgi:hypothetical protein